MRTNPSVTLERGLAHHVLAGYPDDHFDAVVCDPPYGLTRDTDLAALLVAWLSAQEHEGQHSGLLGHGWDRGVPGPGTWSEVLRVLKPGGHVLAFAATRNAHITAVALDLAGFELLDQIVWLHGNGWPKSQNQGPRVAKITGDDSPEAARWEGWGSSLKPANEPILVARKPFRATIAKNLLTHGTGAINVDGCRIGDTGRFPANVVLAHQPDCTDNGCEAGCVVAELDEQTGVLKARGNVKPTRSGGGGANRAAAASQKSVVADHGAGDWGGGSKFFYCAKPSKAERDAGLDTANGARNDHPSVKPVELMRWLIRLVTPPGGLVLDPFCGSGTTLVAATLEGHDSVGIDRDDDDEYLKIAAARVAHTGATLEAQRTA